MTYLKTKIHQNTKSKTLLLEMDADKLERLAANFGFFNPDFLKSIERSELNYAEGRFKKVRSLKELD